MKKTVLVFVLLGTLFTTTQGQVMSKSAGLRIVYSMELSYLHPLNSSTRLEFDLGQNSFGDNLSGSLAKGVSLNCVYQKVWDLSSLAPGFNWYAGAGGALVAYDSMAGAGALGQVGLEYNFEDFPLELSLDYRPGLYLLPSSSKTVRLSWVGPCLSARIRF